MFPDDPWKEISQDAIDLINTEFLQVSIDRRASTIRSIKHKWFSEDEQLYCDLVSLESKVGDRWLTTKEQELKWITSTNL
jgi:protein kinase D